MPGHKLASFSSAPMKVLPGASPDGYFIKASFNVCFINANGRFIRADGRFIMPVSKN